MIKAIILALFIILIGLSILMIYACVVIAKKCDEQIENNYEEKKEYSGKYTLDTKNMNITYIKKDD